MKTNHIYNEISKEYYTNKLFEVNTSVNPFGSNKVTDIAYAKAERLALATYLVTNLIQDTESVKEAIRHNAWKLLEDVITSHKDMRMTGHVVIQEPLFTVRYIMSLLDTGYAAGVISHMNVDVLKNAYANFAHFIENTYRKTHREEILLGEDFFEQAPVNVKDHTASKQSSQGQKKILSDTLKDIKRKNLKDTILSDKQEKLGAKDSRSTSLRTHRRTSNRRIAILDIVKNSGPLHIKEIITDIPDCSEKSIQRELVRLVSDNVLKKEGVKRWTLYSVVN